MRKVLLGLLVLSAVLAGPADATNPGGTWPLAGEPVVVHPFDPPAQPWSAGHRGVDLLASPGETVHSPISGVLAFAAVVVDRPVLVVADGVRRISLEPVEALLPVGSQVIAGQPIGAVTAHAGHCAPSTCLHWGLRIAEQYHDPLLLVGRYRPVLLPCRPELC